MPEMHLRQPGFTYHACGPFTKNKKRIQNFKETGDSRYIYQNELDKACFQHDMVYGDFKDLKRRTFADKVLRYKSFNIAPSSNPRVTSSNPRVTSSNSRVTSSNSRVKTLKARVVRLKALVGRLKARVGRLKARVRSLKARVEAIKARFR